MDGLGFPDYLFILLYFVAISLIGLRAMKRIRTREDYYLGGRRFGKWAQTFVAFSQGASIHNAVGTITTTFVNGASGIWSSLVLLWATPFFWVTSPWYRRMRVLTLGDFFEERYGSKRMAAFYSVMAWIFLMALIAIGTKALSVTVFGIARKDAAALTAPEKAEYNRAVEFEMLKGQQAANALPADRIERLRQLELQKPRRDFSYINENDVVWAVCLFVLVFTTAGGMEAVIYADVVQGLLIIVLSVILIPFGLSRIHPIFGRGALDALHILHQRYPSWYFDVFGSVKAIDFTWYYILAISIMTTLNVAVQATQMNVIGSAKDELTARIGFTVGLFMKRFCTVMWGLFGLIAIGLYGGTNINPDYIWGIASRDLLGGFHLGLLGFMIICLFGALLSTTDTLIVSASGILTNNCYRAIFPHMNEAHYIKAGRAMGALVLIGSALIAIWFDSMLQLMKFIWEFNTILAAAFWCGIKWKRANRPGAWFSMILTLLAFIAIPIALPGFFPGLRTAPDLLKQVNSNVETRSYSAHQADVDERDRMIRRWEALDRQSQVKGTRPEAIKVGQTITMTIRPPSQSIFWSKGLKVRNGVVTGDGMLYIDLVLLDRFFDLSRNSVALNETIRSFIRILLPFFILIAVSLMTVPDRSERLDRFYVKMRTPVIVDRNQDRIEVEKSYADPTRHRDRLLFPNSNLELLKWNKTDVIGFGLAVLAVFGILALLHLLLQIGA